MPILRGRMGNGCSRVKFCSGKGPWRRRPAEPEDREEPRLEEAAPKDEPLLRPVDDAELKELQELRSVAQEKPLEFLLDNLLLSIRLFTHYEKDIAEAQEQLLKREQQMNQKLQPKKTALQVDLLREHFNGRISFRYCRKNDEPKIEPLKPIQVYLAYENVLVTEIEAHYFSPGETEIDYTFILKETEQKGYVRLEKPQGKKELCIKNLSSIPETEDEMYSNGGSIYSATNGPHNGSITDEEIYDEQISNGTFIHDKINRRGHWTKSRDTKSFCKVWTKSMSQRFVKQQKPGSASSSSSGYTTSGFQDSDSDSSYQSSRYACEAHIIPLECLKRITYDDNGEIYEEPKAVRSRRQKRLLEKKRAYNRDVVYVNAFRFAKVYKGVFRHHLAAVLNFQWNDIVNNVRSEPAVYLDKIDYLSNKQKRQVIEEQYELLPCFTSRWSKWAAEWVQRQRGKWPTDEDVRKIEGYDCHLVPSCTKLNHQLWKLNWRLCFPKAERHLESCLSLPQMTVYVVALMLQKTFFRRQVFNQGLTQDHIRNMLFLQVEKQPDWKETDMGKWMMVLLKSLHLDVKQQNMRDYFMSERNLFVATSEDALAALLHSQKQLQRIIENPVMFIFHAMEKIDYEGTDYPRLDYRQLMRLLTQDVLSLINPNLEASSKNQEEHGEGKKIYGKAKGRYWQKAKQTGENYVQSKTKSTVIEPEGPDSIFIMQEKCEPLTRTRLSLVLSFFSGHFLEMARCCHRLGSIQGKELYLSQVRLMALLLSEDQHFRHEATQIMARVEELRASATTPSVRETPPPRTPRRNADPPIFVRTFNDRFPAASAIPEEQGAVATVPAAKQYAKGPNATTIAAVEKTHF